MGRRLGLGFVLVLCGLALPVGAIACLSTADCNDGNPCTDDLCDSDLGCVYAQVSNPCDDGNSCSTSDVCNAGTCVGGSVAIGCTSCQAIATIPAAGGTFVGVTSGTGSFTASCGSTAPSPERVYSWTPSSSGTTVIQTCGTGTLYDSVLHVHAGTCGGAELGCNDDMAGCPTGEPNDHHGSRLTLTVTAGQTYVIVVDGYNGARGTYTLTVTPPSVCGNGLREASESCDGADVAGCPSGQCTVTCTCVPPAGGLPDLVPQIVDVSTAFNTTVFSGDVAEGCAEATSGVDLLRFGAYSRNDGTADFVLGDPQCPSPCDQHPLEVCGDPDFICSPAQGHNHAHYNNYARYDLLDQSGQTIVVGHKQGYCLRDTNCTTPVYTCVNQGVTAGCSDLYGASLGCQYLDITGIPAGTYTLRVTIDPFNRITELSESNNVAQQAVTIVRAGPTTTATRTPAATPSPTVTPTASPIPTASVTTRVTPTASRTATPTPAATSTPSPTPSTTSTPSPTATSTRLLTPTVTPTPAGTCPVAGTVPAQGGVFVGTTSGTGSYTGSCGTTGPSPEKIYQWTPSKSGTATIKTCGTTTTYDSVLYVRRDSCTGTQISCNDDTQGCQTGEPSSSHGSSITVSVKAGRTYFIFVDGYNGKQGTYRLEVIPPNT